MPQRSGDIGADGGQGANKRKGFQCKAHYLMNREMPLRTSNLYTREYFLYGKSCFLTGSCIFRNNFIVADEPINGPKKVSHDFL